MKVSVVIPTYNHAAFVLAALDSVFAQTMRDYEVIVINDGSPDNTAALLRPLADAGKIRYFEQSNRGQAAARNRGIDEARGEYVALLDDDDLWAPDKLAWQVAALDAQPNAALVYGSFRLLRDADLQAHDPVARPSGEVYGAFCRQCWIMSPGQALIRTTALRAVGAFDTSVWGSDDWDLYIRLAKQFEFVYDDRVALHYRLHRDNASKQAVRHAVNHLKVVYRHIGWNVPMLIAHQRAASKYFSPKLRDFACDSRANGRYGDALRGQLLALTFMPSLVLRRWWLAAFAGNLLRRPPRDVAKRSTAKSLELKESQA